MDTDDLKLALERQRGENKELVEALLQLEADYAQLEQERAEAQEEVGRLRRATVAVEETDEVWEELDATKSSLLHVLQELKLLKRQRESLEEEKQEMRDTIQELTTENLTLTKGNFRSHQQLSEVQQAVKQLKVDLQRVKEERDAQGKELAKEQLCSSELTETIREQREIQEVLQSKINQLKEELEDSEQQNALQKLEEGEDLSGSLLCEIVEAKLETRLVAKRRGITYWLWTLASLCIWLQLLAGSLVAAAVLYTYFFDGEFIYRTLPLVLSEHSYEQLASGLGGHLTLHSQGLLPF
ncbi:dynein regulatory complex protein 1 [Platysternon megacephalum]|uniref:Dynein regulatory complex protein 1 n=1 Tax=Platysternon megacephalum TaxID=55544 RepID=A0A4D9DKJ2_9SAUR|nr:dynein regulatory complex protein 1 [Platysternon megacephalum]